MKKRIAYLAVAALSVSMLVGCGSSSGGSQKGSKVDLKLTEVLENVADAATDLKSVEIGIKGSADISAEMQGQKMSVTGDADLSGSATIEDSPAFAVKGSVNYKIGSGSDSMSGTHSAEAYGETEDDEMKVYVQVDNEDWMTDSMDASGFESFISGFEDALEEVKNSISEISEEDLKEVEDFVKLEDKTKFVNKKECYVLSAKIDKATLEKLMEASEEYVEDEYAEYAEAGKSALGEYLEGMDNFNLLYSLYFDKSTYLPVKVEFSVTGKGTSDYLNYDIKKLSLEMNLSVNDAKVSAVPDKVKQDAVETDLGLNGNDYDWDDDDYDWDDDDYDWDDDDYDWNDDDYDWDDED